MNSSAFEPADLTLPKRFDYDSYRINIDIEKTFHVVLLLFSILFISEKSRRFLSLSISEVLNLSQLKRPLNKSAL